MPDFISEFLEFTKAYESPTQFFRWAIIAGVAATLRDNCYLPLAGTRLYPNLYILIVARPAMRKANPLNSTLKLLKYVHNTKIIEGRTSIQAVIKRLGEVERNKHGTALQGASGIVYAEEISSLFTEDDATIPVLTDLYDFHEDYTSSLVTRESTKMKNVVITLLAASNEELLKPIFNSRAIYGGLLSRCLIVYGDRVRHRNSLVFEDPNDYDPSELRVMLQKISMLKGAFKFTKDAAVFYDHWYTSVCPELEKKNSGTGADGRIHTNILKVAMIVAVSSRCELVLTVEDIKKAIEICQELYINYKRLTLGSGKNKDAEVQVTILKILWEEENHKLSREEIMFKCWGDVSDEGLDVISRTLQAGGLVKVWEDIKLKKQMFELTPKSIQFFEEKNAKPS